MKKVAWLLMASLAKNGKPVKEIQAELLRSTGFFFDGRTIASEAKKAA